jgi:hypothetical protein
VLLQHCLAVSSWGLSSQVLSALHCCWYGFWCVLLVSQSCGCIGAFCWCGEAVVVYVLLQDSWSRAKGCLQCTADVTH